MNPQTGRAALVKEETTLHQPVLLAEAIEQMAVAAGGIYLDATLGDGGHTLAILQQAAHGTRVLGIDRDPRSLSRASQRLEQFGSRFIPAQGNYADMVTLAAEEGFRSVDGILMDLGLSSRHLEGAGYGFSFMRDEPLDMRYDPDGPLTAADIVNTYDEVELRRIIFDYGEERRAPALARAIVRNRPIHTTGGLAALVVRTLGTGRGRNIHPATRTFQAIRIAVNDELASLENGLAAAVSLLRSTGRLLVISYHSLEDRLVKTFLAREAAQCICPPRTPICICGHQPTMGIINRRVIKTTAQEVQANPRSRSARMRVAVRL
ncbi:MAG: 16S rRNA (cytosine(1402)-N(4))-methyltransferase [SAR202 cluster bacterium Io17-Chloro-G9]|nr:MAG: 16S rRNA (cytosine(1402)-N(4))-methyltransferase [SAR202 cluster bacterium Io17-Chloro-G9]